MLKYLERWQLVFGIAGSISGGFYFVHEQLSAIPSHGDMAEMKADLVSAFDKQAAETRYAIAQLQSSQESMRRQIFDLATLRRASAATPNPVLKNCSAIASARKLDFRTACL